MLANFQFIRCRLLYLWCRQVVGNKDLHKVMEHNTPGTQLMLTNLTTWSLGSCNVSLKKTSRLKNEKDTEKMCWITWSPQLTVVRCSLENFQNFQRGWATQPFDTYRIVYKVFWWEWLPYVGGSNIMMHLFHHSVIQLWPSIFPNSPALPLQPSRVLRWCCVTFVRPFPFFGPKAKGLTSIDNLQSQCWRENATLYFALHVLTSIWRGT